MHRAQISPVQPSRNAGLQTWLVITQAHDCLCMAPNVDFLESVGQCGRTRMLTVTYVYCCSFSRYLRSCAVLTKIRLRKVEDLPVLIKP